MCIKCVFSKMFKWPIFMSNKKKREIIKNTIAAIDVGLKKTKCDMCGKKFTDKVHKWGLDDFTSCVCILCHKKYYNMKSKDFVLISEQKEIPIRISANFSYSRIFSAFSHSLIFQRDSFINIHRMRISYVH